MPLLDAKGSEVRIDSYVEGFRSHLKKTTKGRVFYVFPQGHVAVWMDDPSWAGHQTIMYAGRYLVRGEPRPEKQRTDIPDRLKR